VPAEEIPREIAELILRVVGDCEQRST
jgi:hypothetical protein